MDKLKDYFVFDISGNPIKVTQEPKSLLIAFEMAKKTKFSKESLLQQLEDLKKYVEKYG
jgi:hypothetical protein